MVPAIIISSFTFLLLVGSIIFCPVITIKKVRLSTYWIIALIGAIILLASQLVPIQVVGDAFVSNTSINPLKILVLFFSMTFLSTFLDEAGFFKKLAGFAVKKAGTNQFLLFIIVYLLVSILTIFTSNDIVILTFTPFLIYFAKNAKINPIPYLVGEFAAANTWSMMLLIGNPTNIYLATSANIVFTDYFLTMAVPTLIAGLTELFLLLIIFNKKLKEKIEVEVAQCDLKSKLDTIIGLSALSMCIILLVISNYIGFEMWLICLCCAGVVLIYSLIMSIVRKDKFNTTVGPLKRLPFELIPFFISIFVIVSCLSYQGVASKIGEGLGESNVIWKYGYLSFGASNILNNIPMSILFSDISRSLTGLQYKQAIYASIVGSNIGAFLTPIGALAGIMFTSLLKKQDVKYSFLDFFKYGILISVPVITIALSLLTCFVR